MHKEGLYCQILACLFLDFWSCRSMFWQEMSSTSDRTSTWRRAGNEWSLDLTVIYVPLGVCV